MAAETDRKYRLRWFTLAVLSLSLAIIGLDNTILNVAIPTLQREFDATASELQWMVDSYILVFAGLLLVMGSLGDRFGRKRALQLGLVLFAAASLTAAFSQTSGQLIALRALMGIGAALIMPSTLSIISDVFPREERGKAIGIWTAVAGLAIGMGPLIGGTLLEFFWWGSVFFVNVPVVAIALIAGRSLVPDSRDPEPSSLDLPGTALSIGMISAFVFAVIEAPERGWTDPLVLGAGVLSAILLTAFAVWELRNPHPMLDFGYFRNPRFSVGAGAIGIAFFALFGFIFGVTQYLQFVKGYSPLEAGAAIAPIAVGMVIGAGSSHRLVVGLGTAKVVAGGLTLLAALLALFLLFEPNTPYPLFAALAIFIAYAMGNIMAPSTDAVMGAVPEAKAGVASAMNDVTRQVGGALGVAIVGSAFASVYRSRIEDDLAGLPPEAAAAAEDSVGAAVQIAASLPGEAGASLLSGAQHAFTDAMGIGALVASAVALLGALLVLRFMPAHHLTRGREELPGLSELAPEPEPGGAK